MKTLGNPVTPGQRHHQKKFKKNLLSKSSRLAKSLMFFTTRFSGRSRSTGQITVRHKGGGSKRLYRLLPKYYSEKISIVIATCYDPSRDTFINLEYNFLKNKFYYSSASEGACAGSISVSPAPIAGKSGAGYCMALDGVFPGIPFHSVPQLEGGPIIYGRAAGSTCRLITRWGGWAIVRLPSGLRFRVQSSIKVTVGVSSNPNHRFAVLGKAGRARNLGVRPTVRGVAMNPVDHPHGGRTNGGRPSVTPWGRPALGQKTGKGQKVGFDQTNI